MAWLEPDIACDSPWAYGDGLALCRVSGLMTSGGGPSGERGQAATHVLSPFSVAGVCG